MNAMDSDSRKTHYEALREAEIMYREVSKPFLDTYAELNRRRNTVWIMTENRTIERVKSEEELSAEANLKALLESLKDYCLRAKGLR